LYANNYVDEAERIIHNAARLNNIDMPATILSRGSSDDADAGGEASDATKPQDDGDAEAKDKKDRQNVLVKFTNLARIRRGQKKTDEHGGARYTLLDVFRNLRLALYCVCMSILWFVAITVVISGF